MLEFLTFMFFSIIEVFALWLFVFILFNLPLKKNIVHIVFVCIILSFIAYSARFAGFEDFAPIILWLLAFVFLWLMFRIQVFYALVTMGIGYLSFALVQGLFILSLNFSGLITFTQLDPDSMVAKSMQLGSSLIFLGITFLLYQRNINLNFVPHSEYAIVKLKNENLYMFIILLVSIVMFTISYYITIVNHSFMGITFFIVYLVIIIALLIYFSIKKEHNDD